MACVLLSHCAEAPLVVVVLREDPLDHFEFDFLVVMAPLVYLPVVLLLVPLALVHIRVYFHFSLLDFCYTSKSKFFKTLNGFTHGLGP